MTKSNEENLPENPETPNEQNVEDVESETPTPEPEKVEQGNSSAKSATEGTNQNSLSEKLGFWGTVALSALAGGILGAILGGISGGLVSQDNTTSENTPKMSCLNQDTYKCFNDKHKEGNKKHYPRYGDPLPSPYDSEPRRENPRSQEQPDDSLAPYGGVEDFFTEEDLRQFREELREYFSERDSENRN